MTVKAHKIIILIYSFYVKFIYIYIYIFFSSHFFTIISFHLYSKFTRIKILNLFTLIYVHDKFFGLA